jgi:excisionase family DNA binding protein
MSEKYLTKKQLAEKFGVSASTVDRWLKAGRIAYFKPGGMVRFTPEAIEAFEKTFTVKATV